MRFRLFVKALAALVVGGAALTAPAQDWPAKPVRLILPSAAGTPIDVVSRLLANKMQDALGQSVIVENRPGADGAVAASTVAKAAADGYTLLLGNAGIFTINPGYSDKLIYDPFTQFAPITRLATVVLVVDVHPSLGVNNLAEFIELTKKNPGKYNYASSTGRSGIAFLSAELLKAKTGADITWVGYSQDSAAMTDLLSNRIAMYVDALATSQQYHRAGKLKILAVTGERRAPQMPEIPTIMESGFAGVSGDAWIGLFAPAGTPVAVINKLNGALNTVLHSPEVSERLISLGFDPAPGTPQQLAAIIKADAERWRKLIQDLNLRRD